jgi:hypothetical protein
MEHFSMDAGEKERQSPSKSFFVRLSIFTRSRPPARRNAAYVPAGRNIFFSPLPKRLKCDYRYFLQV